VSRVRRGGLVKVSAVGSRVLLAALLALLSACASGSPSFTPGVAPDFSARARCERDGLFWHANLGICEKI